MSRAFVKEDERDAEAIAPARAPLPEGAVNYVTPRGLTLLREEKAEIESLIESEQNLARLDVLRAQLAELVFRIASARVIDLHENPPKEVRFGARVRLRTLHGEHLPDEWTAILVGVDEADATTDRISFFSPVAQALIGKRVGDHVGVETQEGELRLEILRVEYEGNQQ
jgi:transcription elongation factor GreB